MTLGDSMKDAKTGVELVVQVMKAAGDNPEVKEAAKNLGRTALTVTRTINNCLLPLAAINFAVDKARIYFSEHFSRDLAEETATIPPENIVEPKASIAGPALQGLAFAHEEPNLKQMYLSLLATAMDGRVATAAHPAFVEIIRQLTSEEAAIIRTAIHSDAMYEIVEVKLVTKGKPGWALMAKHLIDLKDSSGAPREVPGFTAMIDNWIRLGLVEVDYLKRVLREGAYGWIENRPEVIRLRMEKLSVEQSLEFGHGVMTRTAFGAAFAKAVGIEQPKVAAPIVEPTSV